MSRHIFIIYSTPPVNIFGADLHLVSLVGQMEAEDYAKKAYQWAKALRLLDPSIKLVSCGGTSTIKSAIRAASDGHC